VITILIGKTTHALEYEEASIAASAIQPIANLISSLALLVVNCPLGLRFLDTLSIYKKKRFKPVIAL
jgi:predicted permease